MIKLKSIFPFLVWLYLACLAAATVLMYTQGDLWWPATLLLFGPRWLLGLPLVLFIPLALVRRRVLLIPLGLSLVIFLWPFLGYKLSFGSGPAVAGENIRVLSCNTKNGNIDRDALAALITDLSVDVVALQELPRWFALPIIPGWHMHKLAGMAICSRFPMEPGETVSTFHPPHLRKRMSAMSAIIDSPGGKFAFFAVHLPSARFGLENVVSRERIVDPAKSGMLSHETMSRQEASLLVRSLVDSTSLPTIVAGDFNMPRQSRIFRDVWGGFEDAFEETGHGYGWTFHDEFRGIPVPLSIDHVVTRNGATPRDFSVGPDIYSDHRPILADVTIAPR